LVDSSNSKYFGDICNLPSNKLFEVHKLGFEYCILPIIQQVWGMGLTGYRRKTPKESNM
jgi:hypothetical protein